jgi:DNA-binding CsgD family transcriptional regulator
MLKKRIKKKREQKMVKGKPWTKDQEKQILDLRCHGKTLSEIAELMNKSSDAVKQKFRRLGYKVVTLKNDEGTTTSNTELIVPQDLPSIEEALLKLVAAMKALENSNLTKTDILRLRTLIQSSTIYQKRLAEYINFRRIERNLIQLDEKYQQLIEQKIK